MSNPPFGSNNPGQRLNHLQSEPFGAAFTPQQLAQFSAAAAGGYSPQSYSNANAFASGSNHTLPNQTQPQATSTTEKPLSEFARAAYESIPKTNAASGLQPPPAQPIDLNTFKGCKFATLDPYLIELRDIYDTISGTFKWEMCADQEERCVKFCQDNPTRRVFVVSSGSLGRKVVPQIHELPQVYAIYIHCADVPNNLKWANEYRKIRVVCDNDDRDLLPQLAVDIAQTNIEWADALLASGKRDKAIEKYEKALSNLETHAIKPDPKMVAKVKDRLAKCK